MSQLDAKVTFVGNPLKLSGMLFNHTFPLDLSITKYCFQNCPFCFSNLNRKANDEVVGKTEDPTDSFLRLMFKAGGQGFDSQNIIEWCLNKKYPVVFSNNVDPFMPASEAQFKLGERVLRACLESRQPLFIQTKEVYTNDTIKDLLIQGKDLFRVYVSISTLDYETAKKHETIAITPEERLKRIKVLSDAGVKCIVALNPYMSDWQPNLDAYFKAAKEAGAVAVYTDVLHFSQTQKKVVSKAKLGQFIEKSNDYASFFEDVKLMKVLAKKYDLALGWNGSIEDSAYKESFFGSWKEQVWPIHAEGLIEKIHSIWLEEKAPIVITWPAIDAYFSKFPEWNNIFRVNGFAGLMWLDNESYFQAKSALGAKNKLKNIIRFLWNKDQMDTKFLFKYENMFLMADSEGSKEDEIEILRDDADDQILVYDPNYKGDPLYFDQSSDYASKVETIDLE